MSWEGGVDLVGATSPEAQQPNVIVHVARLVHTPAGSAPAGMLLYHPPPRARRCAPGSSRQTPSSARTLGRTSSQGRPSRACR